MAFSVSSIGAAAVTSTVSVLCPTKHSGEHGPVAHAQTARTRGHSKPGHGDLNLDITLGKPQPN